MKILIITTYYPPDTAIAAVRPYMIAKYLMKRGHDVTILRSGEINMKADAFFLKESSSHRIISSLGDDSPAEVFTRGGQIPETHKGKSRIDFLPEMIRRPVAALYHRVMRNGEFDAYMNRRNEILEQQKKAIDKLQDEKFNLVFSTYGHVENIFAGQYAAELFGCKLIQDFRDPVADETLQRGKELKWRKEIQRKAVQWADAVTAVSEGCMQTLFCGADADCPRRVIYNGYEPVEGKVERGKEHEAGVLNLCYTGQTYAGLRDITPVLQALQTLKAQGKIDLSRVRIHYAGAGFAPVRAAAEELQLSDILVDHGYLGREETVKLQNMSDVFLVLSWNTSTSKGILTGKFYEGIRANTPILSVISGDAPYSELSLLNEKYHYGFCYEVARKETQFLELCDYLYDVYTQKMEQGCVDYQPDPALFLDFQYDTLTEKLEDFCYLLLEEEQVDSQ